MRRSATPLAELAARRYGVVGVGQLTAPGVDEAAVRRRRAALAMVRDAIPVTTPTQTLIGLSSVLPRPALERALEAADGLRLLGRGRGR
jgi:hypothetical protein